MSSKFDNFLAVQLMIVNTTFITVLNVDTHLMPITEAIWDARAKWKNIGRMLNLTEGDIQAIHESDDGESLHIVLSQWIHTGNATIYDLLKALENRIVNRSDLAKQIRSRVGENRVKVGLGKDYEDISSKSSLLLQLASFSILKRSNQ